jgi:L-seryl-tRNA(Ser) seleniumtransferase
MLVDEYPRPLVTDAIRQAIARLRADLRDGAAQESADADHPADHPIDLVVALVRKALARAGARGLPRVVNATGVLLHTNLGRAPLAPAAIDAMVCAATEPCAVELDLESGERGERDSAIEPALCALTGCEAALAVNNNAAALLLALDTLAERREVIVSRGELIEIGGSFRLPAILAKSGALLREVGTTNRTSIADYAAAISRRTALILKVHPSNFRVVGFTQEATVAELARLAREKGIDLVEDLGSGALVALDEAGLHGEPLVGESIRAGADLVTFSGDKLLGGPQVGLAVGRRELVHAMRRNPLRRALRVDKLTLAALVATLGLYVRARSMRELADGLPTLRLLRRSLDELDELAYGAAERLRSHLSRDFDVAVVESDTQVGSGAQPTITLKSRAVMIIHREWPPDRVAALFRRAVPAIVGRIWHGNFLLDVSGVERAEDLVPQNLSATPLR